MSEPRLIFIAASGTGGHLLPAIEIARVLKTRFGVRIAFIGTDRPLEKKLIDGGGYTRHIIAASGVVGTGWKGLLRALVVWPRGFAEVWRLIRQHRPAAVVGVGGYASVLPVLVAAIRGVPTWIHEAESRAGWANRFLSLFARRISGAYPETAVGWRAVECTGQPVRREVVDVPAVQLDEAGPRRLLILGGSQGARAVDEGIRANFELLRARGVEVRHQCRPENEAEIWKAYQEHRITAWVGSFIDNMRDAYTWSHIILARAGAGSVLEVGIVNRPAIFVPLASSQGGHQRENAMRLVSHGKALLVEEGPECARKLGEALTELLEPTSFNAMLHRPYPERKTDAAEKIAAGVMAMVK